MLAALHKLPAVYPFRTYVPDGGLISYGPDTIGQFRRAAGYVGSCEEKRVVLVGTDQRITSGPAAKRPHSKAEYMTAPERFADSQIPLAPRAPSIHDPEQTSDWSARA